MLTIHMGMPKTATTGCQRVLSAAAADLQGWNVDYPIQFRDAEGVAHHRLAQELQSRDDLEGPEVSGFLSYLSRATSDVLISSEAFTNALSPRRLPLFRSFLATCSRFGGVRAVLSLRRIDRFMESMYLQEVNAGECSDNIENYLAAREYWSRNFFNGLRVLREDVSVTRLDLLKYDAGGEFFFDLFAALIPGRSVDRLVSAVGRDNVRLGRKAQIVLRRLGDVSRLIGLPLDRARVFHAFGNQLLAFDGDEPRYHVMDRAAAVQLHAEALGAAASAGITEYADYFSNDVISPYETKCLDVADLTSVDLQKIKRHFQ